MRSAFISIALPCLLIPRFAFGEDGIEYLNRVAATYSQLSSFQVEAVAETTTTVADRTVPLVVRVALYSSPPHHTRIDVKDADNSLQTVMIWDGKDLKEFHRWDGTLSRTPAAGFDIQFSPERGQGMGEMLYSTIANGVSSATVRGRETLQVGQETIPCVVLDVTYGEENRARKYSFWISEERAIVLKRQVWKGDSRNQALTSTVVAMTFNEKIPISTFELDARPEVKRVIF